MREYRGRLHKPAIYLTFDLERDYISTGYIDPPSFQGIDYHIPRILDKMREYGVTGTFFLTPEVLERREDLVREIR